jgi:maltose O-acetyltransferase
MGARIDIPKAVEAFRMKNISKWLMNRLGAAVIVGRWVEVAFNVMWRAKYAAYRRQFHIHPSFVFNGFGIKFYGEGQIVIGADSYIGQLSAIQACKGCEVRIGNSTAISHNVRIYTHTLDANDIINEQPEVRSRLGSVTIGSHSWIGANVFIDPGVSIGDHCVIGANSVVLGDIPSNSVAVGAPARVKKTGRRAAL